MTYSVEFSAEEEEFIKAKAEAGGKDISAILREAALSKLEFKAGPRPDEFVKWDKRDEPTIRRNLKSLLEVLVVRNGAIDMRDMHKVTAHQAIIAANLKLNGVESDKFKRSLVLRAAQSMREANKTNLREFHCLLADLLREYLATPEQTHHFVTALNVLPHCFERRRAFHVMGVRLNVRDWSFINKKFKIAEWENAARLHGFRPINYVSTPLVCTLAGRNIEDTFGRAYVAFDLLRTAINATESMYVFKQQWGGQPRPLGEIPVPPVFGVFKGDGTFETLYGHNLPVQEYNQVDISPARLKQACLHLSFLRPPNGSDDLMIVILEAYRKLGYALQSISKVGTGDSMQSSIP